MGEVDVDGMLERLPLRLFYEWMEYYKLNSFGDELSNLRQAITSCVIANAHRAKNQRRFRIDDFIPKLKSAIKRQSNEHIAAFLTSLSGKEPPSK